MKVTTTVTITFEDGKEIHLTKDEALTVYKHLKDTFDSSEISTLYSYNPKLMYPNTSKIQLKQQIST